MLNISSLACSKVGIQDLTDLNVANGEKRLTDLNVANGEKRLTDLNVANGEKTHEHTRTHTHRHARAQTYTHTHTRFANIIKLPCLYRSWYSNLCPHCFSVFKNNFTSLSSDILLSRKFVHSWAISTCVWHA